jgi:hypothetical protein
VHVLGALVLAAVLPALLVKLLYGTRLGHSLLDRVPDEAWDTAHRTLGIASPNDVEARQDADALAIFILCVIACSACIFSLRRLVASR